MLVKQSIEEYRSHINENIRLADPILDPFPHLIIDNFLPSELADLLLMEYKDPGNFVSSKDTLFYNNPNRFADNIDENGGRLKKVSNQYLFKILNHGLIPSTTIKKFNSNDKKFKLHFRGQVTRDTENYSLGVHTDTINKLLTLIVYLSRGDSGKITGTSVFKSPYGLESDGYLMYPPEFFTHVKEIDPVFNRALIFRRSSTSFHGVRNKKSLAPRFTLQLNYFFKE